MSCIQILYMSCISKNSRARNAVFIDIINTTCPLFSNRHVPYPLTYCVSIILWHTACPLSFDILHVPYPLTLHFLIICLTAYLLSTGGLFCILWQTMSPYPLINISLSFDMFYILWQTACPLSSNKLYVPYPLTDCMSLIF